MKEIKTVSEEAIKKLAEKDYKAYQEGQKSFELKNWIFVELIVSQERDGQRELNFSAKSFGRILNALAYLREQNLTKCDVKILDRDNINLKFEVDTTTLPNWQIYRLNQEFGLTIPANEKEEEEDEIFSH